MRYEIQGDTLPVVICYLDGGEKMITEKGAMSWMSPNMHMATSTNGGIGKAFGRMFSGESMFQNIYTAQGGPGMIAFASCFPGSILPYQISPGRELIVQKSGFLASEAGVNLSVFFQKRFGSGLFGPAAERPRKAPALRHGAYRARKRLPHHGRCRAARCLRLQGQHLRF